MVMKVRSQHCVHDATVDLVRAAKARGSRTSMQTHQCLTLARLVYVRNPSLFTIFAQFINALARVAAHGFSFIRGGAKIVMCNPPHRRSTAIHSRIPLQVATAMFDRFANQLLAPQLVQSIHILVRG